MALMKKLMNMPCDSRGKFVNYKTVSVKVPFSRQAFKTIISPLLQEPKYIPHKNAWKACVEVGSFNCIFGDFWHVVLLRNSQTVRRILGFIKLTHKPELINVLNRSIDR